MSIHKDDVIPTTKNTINKTGMAGVVK